MIKKICSRCKQNKTLKEYYRNAQYKNGTQYIDYRTQIHKKQLTNKKNEKI